MSEFIDEEEMDTQRLTDLFRKLDLNGDGRINLEEIVEALQSRGQASGAIELAKAFMSRTDVDNSGDVDIDEFVQHLKTHEQKLRQVFKEVDRNNDGTLDVHELIEASGKLGIVLSLDEATSMIKRMDDDGSNDISWEEWRGFLLLSPGSELGDVFNYWRKSTYLDIGENATVPVDFTPQEIKTGMWWRHLVSGGLAGCVSRTATAPLDRIKVFLQVHGKNNPTTSNGIIGCVRAMIKEGGVLSMWRGNGINVIKIAPESAMKFMAYEQLKTLIRGNNPGRDIRIEERFIAGSLAGAISQTAIYPLEVLKTRLALRKTGEFKNVLDLGLKMFQKEGVKAFYKGYIPNLIGILPYAGIDLAIYESLKRAYLRREPTDNPPVLLLLACGTISSTCGQVASYPLALVRTQLQASYTVSNQGMSVMFRTILQKEGVLGLYRGIVPNFLKVAPAVSISYIVYEKVRQALGVKMT